MAKRVAVILSGCGAGDGSEIREAIFTLLALDRGGAEAVCVAPEAAQPLVFDHLQGQPSTDAPRQVLTEAARLARGQIRSLASLQIEDVDALIFPGGEGVASVLSNFHQKAGLCDVHPDVVRLLKAALSTHRPMGFICLAPILAARVLGPVAGVRITLGPRGTAAAKHAAVMGADVRPCVARDIFVDQKNRVISTPGYMYEDARIGDVASAVEKLTRTVLHLARDRRPAPRPEGQAEAAPRERQPGERPVSPPRHNPPAPRPGDPTRRRPPTAATPGRGSA